MEKKIKVEGDFDFKVTTGKNSCGHLASHVMNFTDDDGEIETYCLKCLFEKAGLKPIKQEEKQ